jgi:hypothetical protein
VIGFSDDASFTNNTGKYNGYYHCDGNNSTPDFTGKFLRGAGTGQNAGTTGGSLTNVHEIVHTHIVNTHTHSYTTGTVNSQLRDSDPSVTQEFSKDHTHAGDLNAVSDTLTGGNPTVTTTESVQPLHKVIYAIQNRNANTYTPVGIIGLWLGTISTIPGNFELVTTYYDYFPKHYATALGDTGGSNTHTHSNNTHTHTGSHNHGTTTISHIGTLDRGSSTTYIFIDSLRGGPVYHNLTTDTVSTTYSTATTSSDSANNEPEYTTVALIKYKGEKGGAFLFNLLR